ncbi:MAG TPA: hypothetical protein VFU60_10315 [Ktedonobacterales bacterium]|nr:hypothetical protein [Ktedonobacterales bacterium]
MSVASSLPSQEGPLGPPGGRAVTAVSLGIVALIAFTLLALPTDLILFDLAEVPVLGAIAQTLYPLALGPEIHFSPLGILPAVAAIVIGRRRSRAVTRARGPSATLARTGALLGWVVVALYAVSVVLVVLSFQGILNPLI